MTDPLTAAGLTPPQVWALYGLTIFAIAVAHVHSFREALAHMRRGTLRWPSLKFMGALAVQHELRYAKRVPMLLLFVLTLTAVVTLQF